MFEGREAMEQITVQMNQLLDEFASLVPLSSKHLLVIGASTSEVVGKKIGTAGTFDVAKALVEPLFRYQTKTGVALAFQCCEHLNRALVIDEREAETRGYEPVSVIPVQNAGGALATYAFQRMNNPVVVEAIRADAGIDIGATLIGMHLKPVAIPVRTTIARIGEAHVTIAKTRPKLIGGSRAVYSKNA